MKRLLAALLAVAAMAAVTVDTAEARRITSGSYRGIVCSATAPCFTGRGRSRGSDVTIVQPGFSGLGIGGGVDLQTMLLLGALGGGQASGFSSMAAGGGLGLGILPLLLTQQLLQPQVIIEERRGRRGRR